MGDDNHPDILAIDLNTISETGTMPRDMTGTGRYPPTPRFKPFTWYTAIRNADPEMMAKIMAADPYFVTQDNGAGAPLHFATTYRQLDMVHHLLNNGAEVNQRDPRGLTPLHRAAHLAHLDGYLEIYEYLLSRGADPAIQANEVEPYLAPGKRPVPAEMACDDEVGAVLRRVEARYKTVPKAREPHPDIGDWWALYDYGLEAIKSWPLDFKPDYPEEMKKERERKKQQEERASKAAHRKAFFEELETKGPEAAQALAASLRAARIARGTSPATPLPGPDPSKPLVAFLFPGQGSQDVGMLNQTKDLPAVQKMLATAKDILGYDLLECCNGSKAALDDTEVAQPALFVAGLAAAERLRVQEPKTYAACGAAAGLSLGEYCALVFAGAMSFEDGLKVVKQRASSMAAAARSCADAPHGMLSVVGLSDSDLEDICRQAQAAVAPAPGGTVCQLANMLFPQGRVISGHVAALEHAAEQAKARGALKAQLLAVSGAFHTHLMEPARATLAKILAEVPVHAPRMPVLSNVTAKPFPSNGQAIREMLARQLVEPVQWQGLLTEIIHNSASLLPGAASSAADEPVKLHELGPGQQIKAMVRRIDGAAWKAMQNLSS